MGHKLVVLSLGQGDLHSGFWSASAQLTEEGTSQAMKFRGSLPAAPQIAELYNSWQLLYSALHRRFNWHSRIEIETEATTNVSEQDFERLCQRLATKLNAWLNSERFRPIEQQLRTSLNSLDEIRFVIETNDNLLRHLPWHLWNFFEDYPLAEVALSAPEYKRAAQKPLVKTPGSRVRILAIFGVSTGVDLAKERALLEQLSDKAATKFLVEPQPEELNDQLWKQGWDILFFAGHSFSREKGWIRLNQTEAITLDQLRNALKKAIASGLKLALFNSCDGLGLAKSLEDLHIPQTIVWREPVPDAVAQEFFQYFLSAFSEGQTLYTAVREARERLEKIEGKYPCASWLPVICQNPAEAPTRWQQWSGCKKRDRAFLTNKHRLKTLVVASLAIAILIMGGRYLGMLQPFELQAFDRLVRLQPAERPDRRLLIVTIDEADIRYQNQLGMQMRWSLADAALAQLLDKLDRYRPRTIGLDIYRDFPVAPNYPKLAARLQQDSRFFAPCKVSSLLDGAPDGTLPPPEVPPKRVSFTDFVADDNELVRRQLLHMFPPIDSPCATRYALSLQLALHYLDAQGIKSVVTPEGELKIASVLFERLKPHTSGYQGIDASGYQVLLNYRSLEPHEIAPQVSLRDILDDRIDPQIVETLQDRIVLIGVTASSTSDYWKTPYSASAPSSEKLIPGVFIHAQMTSQILSAVLDKRSLIWWWPFWLETLWVWVWALIGGLLSWLRRPLHIGLATVTALSLLFGICLGVFALAGWIPLVPAALALVAGQAAVLIWTRSRQRAAGSSNDSVLAPQFSTNAKS